eukprot:5523232-Pleurochrysis_carterae.AAC.1
MFTLTRLICVMYCYCARVMRILVFSISLDTRLLSAYDSAAPLDGAAPTPLSPQCSRDLEHQDSTRRSHGRLGCWCCMRSAQRERLMAAKRCHLRCFSCRALRCAARGEQRAHVRHGLLAAQRDDHYRRDARRARGRRAQARAHLRPR